MSTRFSPSLWLWASLAVVGVVYLLFRFIAPHRVEAPVSKPIPDRSVTSPLNQPGGGAIDSQAYEIYSALYAGAQPEPLAFAAESMTDIPQVDGSCLKPSTPQQREMTDAFEAVNKQSHHWENKFTIPAGYRLLPNQEVPKAQACMQNRTSTRTADCAAYAGLRHVRFLGVPGFDHTHARALVSVIRQCGNVCGSGGIFEVMKIDGTWKRAAPSDFTSNCSWIY